MDLLRPWDELLSDYPQLGSAMFSEHVLTPGEMLFIPRWHWHFIMAIDEATALKWRKERGIQPSPAPPATTDVSSVPQYLVVPVSETGKEDIVSTEYKQPATGTRPSRKPLRLPMPTKLSGDINSSEERPADADIVAPATNEDISSRDGMSQNPSECNVGVKRCRSLNGDSAPENADYSFSVSFWWGARLLKDHS